MAATKPLELLAAGRAAGDRSLRTELASTYCGCMDKLTSRNVAIAIAAVGVVLLLLGLLADVIGVGDEESFGTTQIGLTVVGVALVGFGYYRFTKS